MICTCTTHLVSLFYYIFIFCFSPFPRTMSHCFEFKLKCKPRWQQVDRRINDYWHDGREITTSDRRKMHRDVLMRTMMMIMLVSQARRFFISANALLRSLLKHVRRHFYTVFCNVLLYFSLLCFTFSSSSSSWR